jgi:hypothetical protein
MPLGEHIIDVINRVHAKFHKFRIHRGGDMNLFLFLFPVFCILKEQELRGTNYMKDVVLYEGNPTKFDLYFSKLYFI